MDINLYNYRRFHHVTNVQPNQQITSNHIQTVANATTATLSPAGFPATLASLQLLKNGTPVSSPTSVTSADSIAVRGVSPSAFGSSAHATVLISGTSDIYCTFGVVTAQDPADTKIDAALVSDPSQIFKQYAGNSSADTLYLLILPGMNAVTRNLNPIIFPATNTPAPYVYIPNYTKGHVQRFDPSTASIVHTMDMDGASPYSVSFAPTTSKLETPDQPTHVLVACPEESQVRIYSSENHTLEHALAVNGAATHCAGCSTSADTEYSFWVTYYDTDIVELWHYDGTTFSRTREVVLAAGSKPTHVVVDNYDNAYVACRGQNTVAKVFFDGTATQYVTVGTNPSYVIMNSTKTFAYVLNLNNFFLTVINLSTLATTNITSPSFLTSGVMVENRLYLGSLYGGVFGYIDVTANTTGGAFVEVWDGLRQIEGVVHDPVSNMLCISVQHTDAANAVTLIDRSVENTIPAMFSRDLTPNAVHTSGVYIVADVEAPSPLRVANIASATIIKNGIDVGITTTVVNGDEIEIRATVPADGRSVQIPVMWLNTVTDWVLGLLDPNVTPIRIAGYMRGG